MDSRKYTIEGKLFTQRALTITRLQRLVKLFKIPLAGESRENVIEGLLSIVDRLLGDLPAEFFCVVLQGPVDEVDWGELDVNTATEVAEDFFVFNARFLQSFSRLVSEHLLPMLAPSTTSSAPSRDLTQPT